MTAPVLPSGPLLRHGLDVGGEPAAVEAPERSGLGQLPPFEEPDDREPHWRQPSRSWVPVVLALVVLALFGLVMQATSTAGPGGAGRSASGSTLGQLRVGDTDVLADPAALGRLGWLVGQVAVGRGVLVQEVVPDAGLWLGASSDERVFVHLEAAPGVGASSFEVRPGERIDVNGRVSRLEGRPGSLSVTPARGAAQLEAQAAYVEATAIRLAA